MKLFKGKDIKEICSKAAKGCFNQTNDEEKQCMKWVIEMLIDDVLPYDGYTQNEMKELLVIKTRNTYKKITEDENK